MGTEAADLAAELVDILFEAAFEGEDAEDVEAVAEEAPPQRSDEDSGDDAYGWAQRANMRAARIAEAIAPEYPWPTDEEYPHEAFVAMWRASKEHAPRRRRVWDVDATTEPLFDVWLKNLANLGDDDGSAV
jgi:hypothetical protein